MRSGKEEENRSWKNPVASVPLFLRFERRVRRRQTHSHKPSSLDSAHCIDPKHPVNITAGIHRRSHGRVSRPMKPTLDVTIFVVLLALLGGATGVALSRSLGAPVLWGAIGVAAGVMVGRAYAVRNARRRPPS